MLSPVHGYPIYSYHVSLFKASKEGFGYGVHLFVLIGVVVSMSQLLSGFYGHGSDTFTCVYDPGLLFPAENVATYSTFLLRLWT